MNVVNVSLSLTSNTSLSDISFVPSASSSAPRCRDSSATDILNQIMSIRHIKLCKLCRNQSIPKYKLRASLVVFFQFAVQSERPDWKTDFDRIWWQFCDYIFIRKWRNYYYIHVILRTRPCIFWSISLRYSKFGQNMRPQISSQNDQVAYENKGVSDDGTPTWS